MYSDRFFKENDALKEFMTLCIDCGMIPEISSNPKYNRILELSGLGISVGVEISNDPICIKVSFVKILYNSFCDTQYYHKSINLVISNLIECAKKYNITLGIWASSEDVPVYRDLGFKIIEKYDNFWMEYKQILN